MILNQSRNIGFEELIKAIAGKSRIALNQLVLDTSKKSRITNELIKTLASRINILVHILIVTRKDGINKKNYPVGINAHREI